MSISQEKQERRDAGDLTAAVVAGAVAVALLVYDAVRRIIALFADPAGITVEAPITPQAITADIGGGASATVDTATLVVADVNTVSVVSLVLSIALGSACLIAAAVLAVLVCRRLLRGIVFDRVNANFTTAISMLLLAGGLADVWFENMGLNGVFAALGDEFDAQWELFLQMVPLFVAAMAVGVLVIVFQRGIRLQRDTEGLV